MSAFYNRLKGTADSLLDRFGAPVTITRTDRFGVVSTTSGQMVVIETVGEEIPGASVRLGDLSVLLTASADPKAGDVIVRDGQPYSVRQEINPIRPAGVTVAYEAYLGPAGAMP